MTRQVWQRDAEGRPTRLVTVETYEDAVPTPPTWLCIVMGVVFVAGVIWQGGIAW